MSIHLALAATNNTSNFTFTVRLTKQDKVVLEVNLVSVFKQKLITKTQKPYQRQGFRF